MNPEIFREYDIRGVADTELSDCVCEKIAKSCATYIGKGPIVVGGDIRNSTERIRKAIISGLTSFGLDVIDIGVVPTPVLYFFLYTRSVAGGIQITASHNSPKYNGFKLCHGKDTLYGEQIQEIRRIAEKGDFIKGAGMVSKAEAITPYVSKIKEIITFGPRKLKVAIDCGNGCAGLIAPRLLSDLGCEVIPLFSEPDGNFPGHFPDPTVPENLSCLIATVKEKGCDLGIGFDSVNVDSK